MRWLDLERPFRPRPNPRGSERPRIVWGTESCGFHGFADRFERTPSDGVYGSARVTLSGQVSAPPDQLPRLFQIRLAQPEDAESMVSAFKAAYDSFPLSKYDDEAWLLSNLDGPISSHAQDILVAIEGDRVIGIGALKYNFREPRNRRAEFGALCVLPDAPSGVARGLLRTRLRVARENGLLSLSSRAMMSHPISQGNLWSRGFVPTGVDLSLFTVAFRGQSKLQPEAVMAMAPRSSHAQRKLRVAEGIEDLAASIRASLNRSAAYSKVEVYRGAGYDLDGPALHLPSMNGYFETDLFSGWPEPPIAELDRNADIVNGSRLTALAPGCVPSDVLVLEGPEGKIAELEFRFAQEYNRIHILGLFCTDESIRGPALLEGIKILEEQFPGATHLVVDVRGSAAEAQATLLTLGFYPSIYYPGHTILDGKRHDYVQMTKPLTDLPIVGWKTIPATVDVATMIRRNYETARSSLA